MEGEKKSEEQLEYKKKVNMDTIFAEDLGQFGLYQLRSVLLLSVAVVFIAWGATEYLFTTARIKTRCLIPECESGDEPITFTPAWLGNAVPTVDGGFDNCQRFANRTGAVHDPDGVCPAQLFDQQTLVTCDRYVYENTNTVVYDFEMACDEWRRSLIGSLRTVGLFISLPLVGMVSDRWGRRTALAITAINTAWIGILRVFTNTYGGFLASQVIEAALGGGGFSCAYIIVNETTGPKYRLAVSALMSTCYALFQGVLGLIAWAVPNWRHFTLTIYAPQFLAISFFWILPESARWYLSKGRYEEAKKILKNVARVNRRQISEQTLLALKENVEEEQRKEALEREKQAVEPWLVVLVFQNKPILLRCIVLPVWWITMTFCYYGLTVNAVNIAGNPYVNFVAVSFVEIPGFWIAYFLLDYLGRKPTLIAAFTVCAACQFAYLFMPDNLFALSLAVYLVGKSTTAVTITTVYVYTTELFPTKYRHRLFAFASMMGRIGAIVAPLTPAFGAKLPFILFGSSALFSGLLGFLTPETRGAKLPDTMQEAVDTGTGRRD